MLEMHSLCICQSLDKDTRTHIQIPGVLSVWLQYTLLPIPPTSASQNSSLLLLNSQKNAVLCWHISSLGYDIESLS